MLVEGIGSVVSCGALSFYDLSTSEWERLIYAKSLIFSPENLNEQQLPSQRMKLSSFVAFDLCSVIPSIIALIKWEMLSLVKFGIAFVND